MLKEVVFHLKKYDFLVLGSIIENLLQNEIKAFVWNRKNIKLSEHTLLLTDDSLLCQKYSAAGYFVIAFLTEKNRKEDFSTALYAVESLEGLDAAYFCLVYNRYAGNPLTILETKRCIIREIKVEDVEALYEIYSEPSITEYIDKLFEDIEEERKYTQEYIKHIYGFYGYGMWIVVQKESNSIIGRAGLEIREETEGVELGFVIAKPFQQKGYAYEVCSAVLDYAKNVWQFTEIHCYVKKENSASIALCQKLGFQYQSSKSLSLEEYNDYRKIL